MNADKLLKQYEEAEEIVGLDLSAWSAKTLPGMQARQNEARVEVEKLVKEYQQVVREAALLIFTEGKAEHQTAFHQVAVESDTAIGISVETLYDQLATEIEATFGERFGDGQRIFGTTQLIRLFDKLSVLNLEFGMYTLPMPPAFDVYTCKTHEDTVNVVRNLVRSTVGDKLNAAFLEREITKMALKIRYSRTVMPVVLTGATKDELNTLPKALFNGRSFTVPVNAENTESATAVMEVFAEIQKKLKKQKH